MDSIEKKRCEQERPQVVDGERHLEPIDGFAPFGLDRARIVDQHMEMRLLLDKAAAEVTNRCDRGEIELHRTDLLTRRLLDFVGRMPSAFEASRGDHHLGTFRRKGIRRGAADPGRPAGDQNRLASDIPHRPLAEPTKGAPGKLCCTMSGSLTGQAQQATNPLVLRE